MYFEPFCSASLINILCQAIGKWPLLQKDQQAYIRKYNQWQIICRSTICMNGIAQQINFGRKEIQLQINKQTNKKTLSLTGNDHKNQWIRQKTFFCQYSSLPQAQKFIFMKQESESPAVERIVYIECAQGFNPVGALCQWSSCSTIITYFVTLTNVTPPEDKCSFPQGDLNMPKLPHMAHQ